MAAQGIESAINLAISQLKYDPTPDYDTRGEWEMEQVVDFMAGGVVVYRISDEESLINVNTASRGILENLSGFSTDLSVSIVEWRKANGNFEALEELLLVKGMSEEILSRLKDTITIFGIGRVNINTASAKTLRALGLQESLIEKLITFRKEKAFTDIASIQPNLEETTGMLTISESTQIAHLLSHNLFGVKSENLRISLTANIYNKPIKNASVVFERTTGKIRHYYED